MRGNAVPVNGANISQKFSFIEILELSDFNIRAYCIQHSRAKMSNFACKKKSRVITYTNINNT